MARAIAGLVHSRFPCPLALREGLSQPLELLGVLVLHRRQLTDCRREATDFLSEAAEATAAELGKTNESQRRADSAWLRRFDAAREQLAMDLKWRKIFKPQLTAP